jgi:citrate lyase subunit beta/citryl-CoA lyase
MDGRQRRAPHLRRSWLFLPGADRQALEAGPGTGADALIQELEDFTPPGRRAEARSLAAAILPAWKRAGVVAAVRVNPLETVGSEDLRAVLAGAPDVVMMSKVACAEQVAALDGLVTALETEFGIAPGTTEIVPNVEGAAGIVRLPAILAASPRVTGALLASEDLAADLGVERTREGRELAYARSRFLLECVAAGMHAIDCPYTFSDLAGAEADARYARSIGFRSKSTVDPAQAALVNQVLTPSGEEVARAIRLVVAFEGARAAGHDRVELDGALVEVPTYLTARRLLDRARDLGVPVS